MNSSAIFLNYMEYACTLEDWHRRKGSDQYGIPYSSPLVKCVVTEKGLPRYDSERSDGVVIRVADEERQSYGREFKRTSRDVVMPWIEYEGLIKQRQATLDAEAQKVQEERDRKTNRVMNIRIRAHKLGIILPDKTYGSAETTHGRITRQIDGWSIGDAAMEDVLTLLEGRSSIRQVS